MENERISVERITNFNPQLVAELTQIEAEAFGEGGLNYWTFPVLIRHGAVYVLRCNKTICGVADVIKDWIDPELAFIVGFSIREGERGRGLGYRFLTGIIEELRGDGIRKIQLTVDPKSERAIRLYRKAGFKQIAKLTDEYGPAVDRLLYELELKD
ncbi:MAG: GNAT family N-acetyltransferase [Firmicutes bacterium]|nr:GNAT family N-acetyltransferase [Bacillota bacterium]